MARRDALLRLHNALTTRRDDLRKRLGGELSELRNTAPEIPATAPTWHLIAAARM